MYELTPKNHGTKYLLHPIKEKKIVFRHSHIAITDYTMGDNWEFEKSLSIWDKISFKYHLVGGYYVKSIKEFRINRAYNVNQLRQYFPGYPMWVDNDAYPYDTIKAKLYAEPNSDFQRVALTFMACEGEFSINKKFTQQMITGDTGTGKAQPDDTMIPTPTGWRRLDTLQVGDYVFDEQGNPTRVTGIYPQEGYPLYYQVTFHDGRTTNCNGEHLWKVTDENGMTQVFTTEDILEKMEEGKEFTIPATDAVSYTGSISSRKLSHIIQGIRENTISYIPDDVLYADTPSRIAFVYKLCGQVTDGETGIKNALYFYHRSKIIVEQFRALLWGLGYIPEYTTLNSLPGYMLIINTANRALKITEIKRMHNCRQRCIKVENPSHLYLTENYIVTHNTYCGTASTAFYQAKTVIIVPLAKLLDQWKESYLNFTSLEEDEILIVRGSNTCKKILDGEYPNVKVFIFMTDTIYSFHDKYGDIKTMDMLCATRAYTKIVDEIHLDLKTVSMIEALSNFRMHFYMPASPGTTDSKENWIFKTLFTHIPRFGSGFKTQVEKHLNIMIKKYYFTPTTKQINRMVNRKVGMNGKKYEEVLMYADPSQRKSFETALRLMVQWAKRQCKPGNKIMILGQSVNFLSYIKEVIEVPCSIYYGGMKKKEKEAALLDDIIVATLSSLGTGADIKGVQFVINCATYSSWITVTQVSGRLRPIPGTPTVYIEMVNYGYRKTISQFESRKRYLTERSKTNKIIVVS